jgi:hypothetical protein
MDRGLSDRFGSQGWGHRSSDRFGGEGEVLAEIWKEGKPRPIWFKVTEAATEPRAGDDKVGRAGSCD